ncbi:unnamed protein product [Amoebophrya sp. A120]|nr:unnamed protein product [Amoebophrya sp. A120]|eukprot:GSA120T00002319001.1
MSTYDPDSLLAPKRQRLRRENEGANLPKYLEKFSEKGSVPWFGTLQTEEDRRDYIENDCMAENAKFLSRMKIRSGSYGITCGFLETLLDDQNHVSGDFRQDFRNATTVDDMLNLLAHWPKDDEVALKLTKEEIIERSQKYCNSKMEADPDQDRMFGAWAAMMNMCEKKGLFLRGRRGREHEFSLSIPGRIFLAQFRQKHPEFLDTAQEFIEHNESDLSDEEEEEEDEEADRATECFNRDQGFLHRLRDMILKRKAMTLAEFDNVEDEGMEGADPDLDVNMRIKREPGEADGVSEDGGSEDEDGNKKEKKPREIKTALDVYKLMSRPAQQRVRILRKILMLKGNEAQKRMCDCIKEKKPWHVLDHDFSLVEMNVSLRLESEVAHRIEDDHDEEEFC